MNCTAPSTGREGKHGVGFVNRKDAKSLTKSGRESIAKQ